MEENDSRHDITMADYPPAPLAREEMSITGEKVAEARTLRRGIRISLSLFLLWIMYEGSCEFSWPALAECLLRGAFMRHAFRRIR